MSLYFTKEHEWIRVEGDTATVVVRRRVAVWGIADRASSDLRVALAERLEAIDG